MRAVSTFSSGEDAFLITGQTSLQQGHDLLPDVQFTLVFVSNHSYHIKPDLHLAQRGNMARIEASFRREWAFRHCHKACFGTYSRTFKSRKRPLRTVVKALST